MKLRYSFIFSWLFPKTIFIFLLFFIYFYPLPLWSYSDLPESQPASTGEYPIAETTTSKSSFWKDKFQFTGVLRQETAFRVGEPKNFSKIKEFVKMDFKFLFNDHLHMVLGGRAWYDAVYDLTDQYPPDVNDQMRKEVALRDAYLDIFASDFQIRLGHQQIVWGEALAQFFADVVNPKDLREFILPTFEYIRLPIWALDFRYFFLPNATLELVATPDQQVDKIANPGADFSFYPSPDQLFFFGPFIPGVPTQVLSDKGPPSNFTVWSGGGRITYLTHGWDLSWLYYTTPTHFPTVFKNPAVNVNTGETVLLLNPVHKRINQFGMTFSKGVKSSIFRGEFVYTLGQYFNANDVLFNQGLVKGDALRYVLGFDTTLGGRVDMVSEFQQQAIFGNTSQISDPTVDSWIAIHFSSGFLREKLVPELTFIVGLREGDTMIRPSLTYLVIPSVSLTWGADVFTGPSDTLYGEFDQKSRAYMYTEWRF